MQDCGSRRPPTDRALWLDRIKGLALAWIFINHVAERMLGAPLVSGASPMPHEHVLLLLVRLLGWTGDHGVDLFVVASGFGLALGQFARPVALTSAEFYRKRLLRVYPMWWVAHGFVLVLAMLGQVRLGPYARVFIASALGFRAHPSTIAYFVPAWWFIGLLLQLYLVFPFLFRLTNRLGPLRVLVAAAVVEVVSRRLGQGVTIIPWFVYGSTFLTRIGEFAAGISLAAWFTSQDRTVWNRLQRFPVVATSLLLCLAAFVGDLSWRGPLANTLVVGIAGFVFLQRGLQAKGAGILEWIGKHSYALFLTHHWFVLQIIPSTPSQGPTAILVRSLTALVLSAASALLLEHLTNRFTQAVQALYRKRPIKVLGIVLAWAAACYLPLLGAQLLMRRWSPTSSSGWGERPSLEPHDQFGWRLIPSKTTRLKWESYDYVVQSNALGFPGPDPSADPVEKVRRVLVVGDAFASAEGVDTDKAFPRLLQHRGNASGAAGRRLEVNNFAITGHGPLQYQAVLAAFVPKLKPDVVLIESFVNDFEDALTSNEDFQAQICFQCTSAMALRSTLELKDLRDWLQFHSFEALRRHGVLTDVSDLYSFYAGAPYIEKSNEARFREGARVYQDCLRAISKIAAGTGSRVVILQVPAAIQVCPRRGPAWLDLSDAARFDLELPQRLLHDIAQPLGIQVIDLRDILRASATCPYFEHNLHWTEQGHQIVAEYLEKTLR
jgi:peptidoglycan/LPS O-acetylase OafA/YrhL